MIVPVQRRSRAALLAALLAGVAGASPGLGSRDLFDDIYARGQKQNAGLKTLSASFTETSSSALLARPLVEKGTVYVERPSRVVLRYSDPEPRVVLMDGDRMTVSWPSAKVFSVTDIGAAQRRVQKYFVDSSARELRGHFDIMASEDAERPGTYLLAMTPKRQQILEGVARIDLWLDKTTLLLAAMRMTFPSGESKLMTFADVKPNVPIDPAMFAVKR